LEVADRRKADLLKPLVAEAATVLQAEAREHSTAYVAARARVEAVHAAGKFTELLLREFATGGEGHEAAVALSLMCDVPIAFIDRALSSEKPDQLLVLAKCISLRWETVKALLTLRGQIRNSPAANLPELSVQYSKLQPDTARKAIQFLRLRERTRRGT
jgi:hypothetical protein